jgi:hypothetical protein
LLAKIANLVSGVALLVLVGVDLKDVNRRRGYVSPCWYPRLKWGYVPGRWAWSNAAAKSRVF